jgi:hypothetical protein
MKWTFSLPFVLSAWKDTEHKMRARAMAMQPPFQLMADEVPKYFFVIVRWLPSEGGGPVARQATHFQGL